MSSQKNAVSRHEWAITIFPLHNEHLPSPIFWPLCQHSGILNVEQIFSVRSEKDGITRIDDPPSIILNCECLPKSCFGPPCLDRCAFYFDHVTRMCKQVYKISRKQCSDVFLLNHHLLPVSTILPSGTNYFIF